MASSISSVSQAPCFIANNEIIHMALSIIAELEQYQSFFKASSSPRPLSSSTASVVETDDDDDGQNVRGCGKENGCNGDGRIQGGIATVPGFGWWPIKAYRPCPGFVEAGGRYRRIGQSMDEVDFGRGDSKSPPLDLYLKW
ncbi:LOW QUALITY PROTEIN: hypothetical protein HID58_015224 [Brassica napus]|uniref:Uncharacterized protein n=1 Tax=Brassica napus TaxID=3708 RepID=A0ABQ8DKA0_BRANA|nr:LOW QUALITY PROTEIN: hypothetical protein HID58_015224 [Brassica napus]